ncbi:hypothetical protein EVAR_55782_1 [Eumeta japonica]|uniref:Uncharacterized protein n=1 Tax=Eumeta variegata TaxID=151549 RepID=A0A4C1YKQ2_EUMVA|nr:hypothetical protein EVAR_55782_1 [Eumeta japonica]
MRKIGRAGRGAAGASGGAWNRGSVAVALRKVVADARASGLTHCGFARSVTVPRVSLPRPARRAAATRPVSSPPSARRPSRLLRRYTPRSVQ